jgi:hypothetical protein
MYRLHDEAEVVLASSRKGFVRLAVETGTPLVILYHFGNSRRVGRGSGQPSQAALAWERALRAAPPSHARAVPCSPTHPARPPAQSPTLPGPALCTRPPTHPPVHPPAHSASHLPTAPGRTGRLFKWAPKWGEELSRQKRVSLGFLLGRWGLPLPHRCAC